eukprot:190908-Rhodomonas_salina.2
MSRTRHAPTHSCVLLTWAAGSLSANDADESGCLMQKRLHEGRMAAVVMLASLLLVSSGTGSCTASLLANHTNALPGSDGALSSARTPHHRVRGAQLHVAARGDHVPDPAAARGLGAAALAPQHGALPHVVDPPRALPRRHPQPQCARRPALRLLLLPPPHRRVLALPPRPRHGHLHGQGPPQGSRTPPSLGSGIDLARRGPELIWAGTDLARVGSSTDLRRDGSVLIWRACPRSWPASRTPGPLLRYVPNSDLSTLHEPQLHPPLTRFTRRQEAVWAELCASLGEERQVSAAICLRPRYAMSRTALPGDPLRPRRRDLPHLARARARAQTGLPPLPVAALPSTAAALPFMGATLTFKGGQRVGQLELSSGVRSGSWFSLQSLSMSRSSSRRTVLSARSSRSTRSTYAITTPVHSLVSPRPRPAL